MEEVRRRDGATCKGESIAERIRSHFWIRRTIRLVCDPMLVVCVRSASTNLCGGCWVTGIPTATRRPSSGRRRARPGNSSGVRQWGRSKVRISGSSKVKTFARILEIRTGLPTSRSLVHTGRARRAVAFGSRLRVALFCTGGWQ
jgi:hypothetical protein